MPDKGKIMSQTNYEKQSKLIELYKECIIKKEMSADETVTALRLIGFGKLMAANRVREWTALPATGLPETERAAKLRNKKKASLEKYFSRMNQKK